uniref:Nucleotidyl transferase AbiEii/AbiGii toxin family protein n=1 Tax=Thermodesulfobacterium geofontis TaxID=1295609 RepID=A0A7C4JQX2_9BACT
MPKILGIFGKQFIFIIMFYEKVFKILAEKQVKYAVIGGVALVLYGVVRLTADLDLIVELSTNNLNKFIEAIKELKFIPKLPVKLEDFLNPELRESWYKEKNMIVFTFYNPSCPIEEIDVFIKEIIPFNEIEKELKYFQIKGITIPVVSKRHLKQLKAITGRPQDIADIKAIEELEKIEREDLWVKR